jgi:hypothetical protein
MTLADFWSFLQADSNRAVPGWLGGGIVVVAGGFWSVYKFRSSQKRRKDRAGPVVSASRGGVAAGRDIRNSTIDTNTHER